MTIAELYFSLLPANYLSKSYMCMCFIKHWLHENGLADFKAETIAEASEGLFDKQLVGTTLRNLMCRSMDKYPTINGKRSRRKYWKAETVYTCYLAWGIPAWNLDYCYKVQPVETIIFNDKNTSNTAILDKRFDIMVGSAGHVSTLSKRLLAEHNLSNIDYYSFYWNKVYNNKYDFDISYSFVNSLNPILLETHNSRGTIWLTESISKCLEIPSNYLDKDGYAIINQPLLNKLELPPQTYNLNVFPTTGIHRLVTMTNHPTLNWHLPRSDSSTYVTAHHTCFNRACVNPKHLMPMEEEKHSELHNKLRDNHAYNNPNQHFQVVEKTSMC